MDCLASKYAVIDICWSEHAGLQYLKKEDAAICIDDISQLEGVLRSIAGNHCLTTEYSIKAYSCGVRNQQIEKIQTEILNDFKTLISINN